MGEVPLSPGWRVHAPVLTYPLAGVSGVGWAGRPPQLRLCALQAPDWVDAEECHRCRVQFGVVTRKVSARSSLGPPALCCHLVLLKRVPGVQRERWQPLGSQPVTLPGAGSWCCPCPGGLSPQRLLHSTTAGPAGRSSAGGVPPSTPPSPSSASRRKCACASPATSSSTSESLHQERPLPAGSGCAGRPRTALPRSWGWVWWVVCGTSSGRKSAPLAVVLCGEFRAVRGSGCAGNGNLLGLPSQEPNHPGILFLRGHVAPGLWAPPWWCRPLVFCSPCPLKLCLLPPFFPHCSLCPPLPPVPGLQLCVAFELTHFCFIPQLPTAAKAGSGVNLTRTVPWVLGTVTRCLLGQACSGRRLDVVASQGYLCCCARQPCVRTVPPGGAAFPALCAVAVVTWPSVWEPQPRRCGPS